MKKLACTAFVVFIAAASFAQSPYLVQKGNFLAGGRGKLTFSSQEYLGEKLKETHIQVRPGGGYFLVDKLAVGLNLDYENTKIKLGNDVMGKSNELGAGIWTRYYLLPATRKINVFAEAGFSLGGVKQDDDNRINYNSFNGGLSMAFFLNRHIALEAGVDYSSKKYEDEDSRINKIGLFAGFQMHFEGRKKK